MSLRNPYPRSIVAGVTFILILVFVQLFLILQSFQDRCSDNEETEQNLQRMRYDHPQIHAPTYRLYTTDPFTVDSFANLFARSDEIVAGASGADKNFIDWFETLVMKLLPTQPTDARIRFYTNAYVVVAYLNQDGFSAFDSMMRDQAYDDAVFRRLGAQAGIDAIEMAEDLEQTENLNNAVETESGRLRNALENEQFDVDFIY